MKNFRRKTMFIGLACISAFFTGGCALQNGADSPAQPVRSTNTAMGTIIQQTVYAGENGQEVTEDILRQISGLEKDTLSKRLESSEIYQINASAGAEGGTELSKPLQEMLGQCLAVSEASDGAFDITMGSVVELWDIDEWAGMDSEDYELPTEKAVQNALNNTGYENIILQDNRIFLPERMQLDLGAVGKGIALDEIRNFLDNREDVSGAVISAGGSILTYGKKPDGTSWKVAVVNPLNPAESIGYLSVEGGWCVSTSGDYERYVEKDGVRYHHILDPKTGYPADGGVSSVTILSENGLLSDALSTACFVLGKEKGSYLAKQYGAEALFVNHEGEISMTEGMEKYFHLSK